MPVPFLTPRKSEGSEPDHEFLKRRSFMKYAGFAAVSSALIATGCKDILDELPISVPVDPDDYVNQTVMLGGGDTGVLNYAYVLEQLEAAFYIKVVASPKFASLFDSYNQRLLREIRDHEVVHRDFFKAALGKDAIRSLRFDFSAIDFDDKTSVLTTAKTFEDLGVAAYNGAGRLLSSPDLLTIAGKIVSVEARHVAAIRTLLDADPTSFAGDDVIDANGLDQAFAPAKVLTAADPFVVNKIDASQLI